MPAQSLILAVDATHEFGSLALVSGGAVFDEVPLHSPSGFGHILFGRIGGLLERHRLEPRSIDCFAAASGPGSFTGVRVGLACIKGLAEAFGKPVVGVSNLQAVASFGTAPLRAAVLDARRGEVYGAVYGDSGRLVSAEVVSKFSVWLEGLPTGVQFVSPDFMPFQGALAGTRFADAGVVTAPRALAGAVARIALARFLCGEAADPAALDANYVRRPDAELLST